MAAVKGRGISESLLGLSNPFFDGFYSAFLAANNRYGDVGWRLVHVRKSLIKKRFLAATWQQLGSSIAANVADCSGGGGMSSATRLTRTSNEDIHGVSGERGR
jgi:hypothetical protein